MYVIERSPYFECLHIMTAKELGEARERDPHKSFKRVDPDTARAWVKAGRLHTTPLWVDEGKVRFARG